MHTSSCWPTSETTVSSEGLTSTTVSRTSLLWWRVLCPVGGKKQQQHSVNVCHEEAFNCKIQPHRGATVGWGKQVDLRLAVWPKDTSPRPGKTLFESGRSSLYQTACVVITVWRTRQPTFVLMREQKLEGEMGHRCLLGAVWNESLDNTHWVETIIVPVISGIKRDFVLLLYETSANWLRRMPPAVSSRPRALKDKPILCPKNTNAYKSTHKMQLIVKHITILLIAHSSQLYINASFHSEAMLSF